MELVNDGTEDCPEGDDEIHDDHNSSYYDDCTVNATSIDPNDGYYECWMNDWRDEEGNLTNTDGYDEDECTELSNSTWECERHDDDHDDMDEFMEMMFTMLDTNEDGSLDASELHAMMEMGEDEHEEGVAFIGFHVEEEGDYGIALPAGVSCTFSLAAVMMTTAMATTASMATNLSGLASLR